MLHAAADGPSSRRRLARLLPALWFWGLGFRVLGCGVKGGFHIGLGGFQITELLSSSAQQTLNPKMCTFSSIGDHILPKSLLKCSHSATNTINPKP